VNLTEDQLKAEQYILSFLKNKMPSMLLIGKAGTGKSFVIARSVKKMSGLRVGLTAPTNKAADVLKNFANENGLRGIKVSTLHSLLRLRPKLIKEGNQWVQRFEPDKSIKDRNHPLWYLDLVVIDEASMLNFDLYDKLISAQSHMLFEYNRLIKLLFVGDRYQLPPVHEKESIVFSKEKNVVELKTTVRQSLDNPIGVILNDMSEGIFDGIDSFKRISNMKDYGGVYFTNDKKLFLSGIIKKFKSKEYLRDKNYCRILCWTNDKVKKYNRYVREHIIENYEEPFIPGEVMIIKSTAINPLASNSIIANISEEFIIEDVFKTSFRGFKCFILYINFIDRNNNRDNNKDKFTELRVLHPGETEKFKNYLNEILKKAKESGNASDWRDFYSFKDMFTEVDYSYALTVHNSQGSTFHTVFVDETDIDLNLRSVERMQCKYTAFSRPSNKLIVYTDKI
jgi:exodeoxyribonuclease-5